MKNRYAFLGILIVMLALMLAGCSHSKVDTAARMEKAADLLQEKYGETFVVTEYLGDNARYKTFNVEAYAEAYPKLRFGAIVDIDGDGMRDFYVAKRVAAKAAEKMEEAVSDIECSHFIFVSALDMESTLQDPDASVEEFTEDNKKKEFMVYLYMDKQRAETGLMNDCMRKIAETIDCASGYIQLFLTGEDMIEEVKAYTDTQRMFYGSYQDMTNEDLVRSFRFEKGVMTEFVEK
ncbi:MAG: hypothetical protein K6E18_05445 [Lachnospiraceae bacterium]|nr:hypothetical protein [Lachnospiraceae bacterium]